MSGRAAERRLASIVALDVAGYSARTERDEPGSVAEIAVLREAIQAIAAAHAGRIFNTAGDGFMLEFASSLGAVEAAIELAETCVPRVRVGVHLCDVAVQPNGDLLGHGVNVTARLMGQAAPGSALVSQAVRQTLHGPILQRLTARGALKLDKMAETIEAFALVAATPAAAPPKGAEPLLAVLPFDNLSADPEMQFFSDGVSEEIMQRLAQGAKLKVVGRTSSFQYRGADKSVRKVAAELHATHILDGSIRRAAQRVRVAAHLVEAATQTTQWSDQFDRTLEDIFAVQDEIAESIALSLNRTISGASTAIDPAAYDLYLQGSRPAFAADEYRRSVALLEQAVARAPQFANAWGMLAERRAELRYYRPTAERDAIAVQVSAESERALTLDPQNRAARAAQFLLLPPFGKFIEAQAICDLLHQEGGGEGQWHRVDLYESTGRMSQAIEVARRAFELDPMNPMAANVRGQSLLAAGRLKEARLSLEAALQRWPDLHFVAINLIILCAFTKDWAAVDALLAPGRLAQHPLREFERDAFGYVAVTRDTTNTIRRAYVEDEKKRFAETGFASFALLQGLAQLGEMDEAFAIAATARFGPQGNDKDLMGFDAYRPYFLFHALWPELRRDPRFVGLCARLGLVDFWCKTQEWPDCAQEVAPYYDFRGECERVAADPPPAA